MADIERRVSAIAWPDQDMEIRAVGDGLSFRGYAAVFDSPSEDLGGFRETIRHGAFAKTLKDKTGVRMLWNHNDDILLGSTRAKPTPTLRLIEDERGLLAEADFPDTPEGRSKAENVRRGDVDAMSFGFMVRRDAWPDKNTRELVEVRLIEVSPVVWPAYPATSATVRHLAQVAGADEDLIQVALDDLVHGTEPLTDQARDLLMAAVQARSATRYIPADVAAEHSLLAARLARLTRAA
jgi:HK97 family phage prohead protease